MPKLKARATILCCADHAAEKEVCYQGATCFLLTDGTYTAIPFRHDTFQILRTGGGGGGEDYCDCRLPTATADCNCQKPNCFRSSEETQRLSSLLSHCFARMARIPTMATAKLNVRPYLLHNVWPPLGAPPPPGTLPRRTAVHVEKTPVSSVLE